MLRQRYCVVAAIVAAWSSTATAAAGTSDLNAALFGLRPSATGVSLSPSGNQVVYVAPAPGGKAVAFIADVQTGDAKPFLRSGKDGERLRWCGFATERRLVCQYGGVVDQAGDLLPYNRLIAINNDGSALIELGQSGSYAAIYGTRGLQYGGDIIDWLPGSAGSVLMQHVRQAAGLGVDRIDTNTGKVTAVLGARRDASFYMTDGNGNVRVMGALQVGNGAGEDGLTGKIRYYYRPVGSNDWKTLIDFVKEEDVEALAVDPVLNALYLLKPLDGRKALYRMKLDGSGATELVASHPKVDIDDVVRSANGQKVIGYTYSVDKPQVEYFDPEYKALSEALSKAIPNLPLVRFEGASVDGNKILMFAGADNDPGRYFVFDKQTKNLAEIMLERPDLENRSLATVKPVGVALPDGVTVPAYLTLPPGREAKNLPAVVLPHGGPASRDQWGFDWLAQYLASRGYAVLQPEYRGSAGYGDSWLLHNGFKSWRTSIGDITASAKWLAAQGIADPNRLAILGWSYGGYAALQSAAIEPGLFKAVVAIAPVTDLDLLKQEATAYTNAQIVADYIGSGPNIAEGSPLRHAAAIKAPVLLAHGDMDWTVRIIESDKMDAALAAAGNNVSFLRFKGLDHQLEDSDARIEMLSEIGKLLDKTIGH